MLQWQCETAASVFYYKNHQYGAGRRPDPGNHIGKRFRKRHLPPDRKNIFILFCKKGLSQNVP